MKKVCRSVRYLLIFFALGSAGACTRSASDPQPVGSPTGPSGTVSLELTDAPIDDASVQGVFVTVAQVKIDGKVFPAFTGKKTINVLALQNGNVESLGLSRLEAGTYSNISLVLDYSTDASGNAPGCYVLSTGNQKYNLAEGGKQQVELKAAKALDVKENAQTSLVMDLDLRKAVKDNNGASAGGYQFASENELQSMVRLVSKERTGAVTGKCSNTGSNRKVVVFAYPKGQFNKSAEVNSQFQGAVTSAAVDGNGTYKLSFLEEGNYELYFAGYQTSQNATTFQGLLQLNGALNLNSVSVKSGAEVRLDVSLGGLLSL
ncbi:DUF4382 domain-containing protein [Spirosoma taeanense]|uniref:DUF4382 domain-containing protein n=1 Tax=Spirosoma taeanense TaxID=2735870 RepID=A0A6M5Y8F3_9BACT|nr:DUF4382 domain-containing protein [Spirosoma taeanense]QJW90189.1 DUF4382 domain-containing protein [Spirosoma taeanense]